MNLRKLTILCLLPLPLLAKDSKVSLTREFSKKQYNIENVVHSVEASLFQGRNKYGISGKVSFVIARGHEKKTKIECRYAKDELMLGGTATDMPTCKLNGKVVFGKYNIDQVLVTNQLLKADQRRPGESEPYCTRHVLSSTLKVISENIAQGPVNFGYSETIIYSTCQDESN